MVSGNVSVYTVSHDPRMTFICFYPFLIPRNFINLSVNSDCDIKTNVRLGERLQRIRVKFEAIFPLREKVSSAKRFSANGDSTAKGSYINYLPNDRRTDRWLFPSRGFLTLYMPINLNIPLGLTTVHTRRINV